MLKTLGVRFGAFSLYLPELLTEEARTIGAVFAEIAAPRWRPAADALTNLPHPPPPSEALGLRGLRAVAGLAVPALTLERLDALSRNGAQPEGAVALTPELMQALGWSLAQAEPILRALGFVRIRKAGPQEASLWRRRSIAAPTPAHAQAGKTPAAPELRAQVPTAADRRARRRRARRRAAAAAGTAG